MAEAECPECGEIDAKDCVYCCPHAKTEVKNIREGHKGRYLREVCICSDCGYYEVMNEMDYYEEFPCL